MRRIRFVTRRALIRLSVLFALLGLLAAVCYFTMVSMPGTSWSGPLAPLSEDEAKLAAALEGHVVRLAKEIGERRVRWRGTLEKAALSIEEQLRAFGYQVEREEFSVDGEACRNLRVE